MEKITEVREEDIRSADTWEKGKNLQEIITEANLKPGKLNLSVYEYFSTSTFTNIADPWLKLDKQRGNTTNTVISEPKLKRHISPSEARQAALKILADAESERIKIDIEEASKGIDWE
jgi:hypothetical protein